MISHDVHLLVMGLDTQFERSCSNALRCGLGLGSSRLDVDHPLRARLHGAHCGLYLLGHGVCLRCACRPWHRRGDIGQHSVAGLSDPHLPELYHARHSRDRLGHSLLQT